MNTNSQGLATRKKSISQSSQSHDSFQSSLVICDDLKVTLHRQTPSPPPSSYRYLIKEKLVKSVTVHTKTGF